MSGCMIYNLHQRLKFVAIFSSLYCRTLLGSSIQKHLNIDFFKANKQYNLFLKIALCLGFLGSVDSLVQPCVLPLLRIYIDLVHRASKKKHSHFYFLMVAAPSNPFFLFHIKPRQQQSTLQESAGAQVITFFQNTMLRLKENLVYQVCYKPSKSNVVA